MLAAASVADRHFGDTQGGAQTRSRTVLLIRRQRSCTGTRRGREILSAGSVDDPLRVRYSEPPLALHVDFMKRVSVCADVGHQLSGDGS